GCRHVVPTSGRAFRRRRRGAPRGHSAIGRRAMTTRRAIPATTTVLALLCAMYFINYIVRVNVSTAASAFQPELNLTNTQVGLIFSAFAYPYLVFQVTGGWIADRFGAR